MARLNLVRGRSSWVGVSGLALLAGAVVAGACGGNGTSPGGSDDAGSAGADAAGSGGSTSGGTKATGGGGTKAGEGAMPEGGGGAGETGDAGSGDQPMGGAPQGGASSGGEGGDGPAPPPLTVVTTTPSDASLDAEPEGDITLQFSEELNAATVTSESIELRDVFLNQAIPSQLSVVGDTLTIAPAARLGLVADYEVTVKKSVADAQGVALADDYSFSFMIRDGSWHEQPLATGKITFLSQNIGLDNAGTAFISWVARPPTAYCPTTAMRVPLLGNPDAAAILTQTTYESDCRAPRTAAAGVGIGAASWEEDSGMYVSQHRGTDWVKSEAFDPYLSSADVVNLTVLPDGVVHLMARSGNSMVARHTDATGAWTGTRDVLTTDAPRSSPSFAFDAEGNGFAAWRSRDVDRYEMILVSSYSKAQGAWTPASKLPGSVAPEAVPGPPEEPTHYRGAPSIAINAAGEAAVVWVRGSAQGAQLYANRHVEGVWQSPELVSSSVGGLVNQEPPALVAVGNDFVVAWSQTVAAVNNTYTARSTLGVWSQPQLRSDGVIGGLTRMPRLGADEHQNLHLVWPRKTGTADVYDYVQARYVHATDTWYGPTPAIATQVTDKLIDAEAPSYAVPGYQVALPFAVAPSGVSALAWASRPISVAHELPADPKLGVFH